MATTAQDHKDNIGEHIEHASIHSDVDVEKKATVHATINGHEIDEETAKYLDPTVVIDEATNKRIKAMLDRRILVVMVVTYFFQTLDKGTLAFSAVMGIREDNNLVGQQYALLGTILYVGILVGEVPVNRLIQRVPLGKLLGCLIISWGIVVLCHAPCTNWGGLMAVRFFLGLLEAGVQPCLMTITTMYYRREEHSRIIAYWYCQQGVQLIIAGLLAYGLTFVEDGPIKAWQALFILVGGSCVLWGITVLIVLPDSPMKAKCWSERDKTLIIERLRVNELGVQDKRFKFEQMYEAFKDPFVWCLIVMQISAFIITNGLSTFSNILVNGLGFSVRQTQLLNLAQGALSICIFVGSAWLAHYTQETMLVLCGFMGVACAGTVVLMSVPVTSKGSAVGLLIAFYAAQFVIASGNLMWSLVTRNIAGQTKKVTTLTLMFVAYSVGAIIGPQVFQAKDRPRYIPAWIAHVAIYVFFICVTLFTRILLMRRNMKKRKAANALETSAQVVEGEQIGHANAFADKTDITNPDFRYQY